MLRPRDPSRTSTPGWILLLVTLAFLAPPTAGHAGIPDALHAPDLETPETRGSLRPPAIPAREDLVSRGSGDYTLRFTCPTLTQGTATAPLACPFYVLDPHDIMAQPILLVDPVDPSHIAFNALHGGRGIHPVPDNQPPTERSRQDSVHQPHTTFRTTDGGATWHDMPYYAPDALQKDDREIYGEDNAAALDGEGRLNLASLYAYRDGEAGIGVSAGEFRYAVGAWKANRVNRPVDYHVNGKVLFPGADGANRVDSLHMAHVPETRETLVLWRESTPEGALDAAGSTPGGKSSFVQIYHSKPEDAARWEALDATQAIGPCRGISNPVVVDHRVLVGCYPDEGYAYSTEQSEALQIHLVDTRTWTTQYVGPTLIDSGHALLVPRGPDGDVALVASGLDEESHPRVRVSYSRMGLDWTMPQEIAEALSPDAKGVILEEARVTAAAYAPPSGNLHLIYMERYAVDEVRQDQAGEPEFYKAFASIRAEGAFQGKVDLEVGKVSRVEFSPTLTGFGVGAFSDLHDSIVVWTNPETGARREFVAFGDYGYVRFGEVVEENFLPPITPLATSIPPIPLASAGVSPALVGLPAGLLAGSMVLRMLLVRKKQTVEAPDE